MGKARYLNVDCILRSNRDLTPIADHLKDDVFLLWNESSESHGFIGLETKLVHSGGPRDDVAELLRLFEGLPPQLGQLLGECGERRIDIGFASGDADDPLNAEIDAGLIRGLSSLGFSLSIRVYPCDGSKSFSRAGTVV